MFKIVGVVFNLLLKVGMLNETLTVELQFVLHKDLVLSKIGEKLSGFLFFDDFYVE
jgi:hypothetical protein